jgi:hypothetical protein
VRKGGEVAPHPRGLDADQLGSSFALTGQASHFLQITLSNFLKDIYSIYSEPRHVNSSGIVSTFSI